MQLAISDIQQSKFSKKKDAAYYGVPNTFQQLFSISTGLFLTGKN